MYIGESTDYGRKRESERKIAASETGNDKDVSKCTGMDGWMAGSG